MATEDYTTYTESDPSGELTVVAAKIDWADVRRDEGVWVYDDFGAAYFSGDFTHEVECELSADGGTGWSAIWGMANAIDTFDSIADIDHFNVSIEGNSGSPFIGLRERDSSTNYSDNYGISLGVRYYLSIERNEAVGTYGTIYCKIYSDSGRTTLLDTLSVTLHTSKKDFQYLYGYNCLNTGDAAAARTQTGFVQNLELLAVGASISTLDSPVLDAEQNNAFTVSGETGAITSLAIDSIEGFTSINVWPSLAGTTPNFTYDLPDVAAYAVDTVGTPFDSASWTNELRVGTSVDGNFTSPIVYSPKAGWALTEVASARTTVGSLFFGWTGTPANTDQVYYPTANTTAVAANGTLTTNQLTGTIDMVFFDTTDQKWKPFSIIISAGPPSGSRDTYLEIANYLRTQSYVGTNNDVIMAWLESVTSSTGSMEDLWLRYLQTLYANAKTFNDAYYQWKNA